MDWWETFAEMEAQLRQMMDDDKDHTPGAEIVAQMEDTLNLVFDEISFEMGFNGEKHELILTPEGDEVKLFELVYFRKHAPRRCWSTGTSWWAASPAKNIGLRTDDGWDISGEDVQIWLEEQGENSFAISAYCEKAAAHAPGGVKAGSGGCSPPSPTRCWARSPHEIHRQLDVLEEPKAEPSILMSQLPDALKERGLELSTDPKPIWRATLATKWNPTRTRTPTGGWM